MNVFTDALNIPKQIFGDYQHFHDLTLNKMTDNAFHVLALTEHKGAFEVALWEKTPGSKSVIRTSDHFDIGCLTRL